MAVFTLTSLSTTVRRASATLILSSLSKNDNNTSPSPSPRPDDKLRPTNTVTPPKRPPIRSQPLKQRKPSVSQIERAIGAGDPDTTTTTNRDSGLNYMELFDAVLSNSIGRTEGDVEKKLRETGEWLAEGSSSGSAGKNILKFVILVILPMWILLFLVASGVLKLPFSSPFY